MEEQVVKVLVDLVRAKEFEAVEEEVPLLLEE
jgi:hypothetical protein